MTESNSLRPQYCRLAEAAERCQVSERTIRRMVSRGEIEARRFGRALRINIDSLATAGRPVGGVR